MNTDSIPLKRCTRCKQEMPASPDYFHRNRACKGGFNALCKPCNRAHVEEWRQKNPAKRKAQAALRRQRHPDKVRSAIKQWKRSNPSKIAEYFKDYYARNRHKVLAHKATPHGRLLGRLATERRRARILEAGGSHTLKDIDRQMKAQHAKCYYCHASLRGGFHVEHIVPISRGGSDNPENLVLACPECNFTKSNKLPHEWPKGGHLL